MKVLKKKDFKKGFKPKVDELVNQDGSIISGDKGTQSDGEIETGPVEKSFDDSSDYKKGMSTTTDRKKKNTSQGADFRNAYGVGGHGPYAHIARGGGVRMGENIEQSIQEENAKKMVEDLISKKKDSSDFVEKNPNNISDISKLSDKPIISGKISELLNTIKDNSLSSDEIAIILNHITKTLSPKISSPSAKKQIFKSLSNA